MVGFHVLNHEIDTGYGRAHYLEPARVQQASVLLEGVSLNEFKLRAKVLAYTGYERLADHGTALAYYAQLREFYLEAAEQGRAVIVTPR
jgi:uncharacterized protein DUF1877